MLRNPVVAIVMAIVCWSSAKAGGPATAVHIDADVYAEESTVDAPEHTGQLTSPSDAMPSSVMTRFMTLFVAEHKISTT